MNPHTLQHALETAFAWTWQTSLQATVVIALVLLVQFALRKILTPRWSYALGLLMLLRLALPFAPASPFSIFNLGHRFATRPAPRLETASLPMPLPAEVAVAPAPIAPVVHGTGNVTVGISAPAPKAAPDFNLIAACLWLAGGVMMLATVARRHRRFVLALRRWEPVREPRVTGLLEECRARLGVRRRVGLLTAHGPGTPALFGLARPRLLIPSEMLRRLDDRELRHIFLHELVHLRRGDILLNWAMILLRALHWFNPAVWLALKKLRADQELACDAAVMSLLAAGERREYGGTLLRLLGECSAARPSPGFVPFITNKHTIKRRITMISTFKPAGRLAVAASVALLIAIGCFTLTRAADQSPPAAAQSPAAPLRVTIDKDGAIRVGDETKPVSLEELKGVFQVEARKNPRLRMNIARDEKAPFDRILKIVDAAHDAKIETIGVQANEAAALENPGALASTDGQTPAESAAQSSNESSTTQRIRERIQALREDVRHQQELMNQLRRDLAIPTEVADGKASSMNNAETLRQLQTLLVEKEMESRRYETMLSKFGGMGSEELRQVLPTAAPDQILTSLLQDRNTAESLLAKQKTNLGDGNPDVLSTKQAIKTLDSQIDTRVKGILGAIKTLIEADHAQVNELKKNLEVTRMEDLDSARKYQPYFDAREELAQKQKTLEAWQAKLLQMQLMSPPNSPLSK